MVPPAALATEQAEEEQQPPEAAAQQQDDDNGDNDTRQAHCNWNKWTVIINGVFPLQHYTLLPQYDYATVVVCGFMIQLANCNVY